MTQPIQSVLVAIKTTAIITKPYLQESKMIAHAASSRVGLGALDWNGVRHILSPVQPGIQAKGQSLP